MARRQSKSAFVAELSSDVQLLVQLARQCERTRIVNELSSNDTQHGDVLLAKQQQDVFALRERIVAKCARRCTP